MHGVFGHDDARDRFEPALVGPRLDLREQLGCAVLVGGGDGDIVGSVERGPCGDPAVVDGDQAVAPVLGQPVLEDTAARTRLSEDGSVALNEQLEARRRDRRPWRHGPARRPRYRTVRELSAAAARGPSSPLARTSASISAGRHRPAEVVALREVAAERLADAPRRRPSRHPRRRPAGRGCAPSSIVERTIAASFAVVGHLHHERAVDLHLVDRQALEVAERRVAGAEVVDREHDAHLAQAAQDRARAHRVGDDHALGDLELERGRRDVVRRRAAARPSSGSVRS